MSVRFLERIELEAWCAIRSLAVGQVPLAGPGEGLSQFAGGVYAEGRRGTNEVAIALRLVASFPPWAEALLHIRDWGVWPSSEDWPAFYALRGDLGEHRELRVAPSQLFDRVDSDSLAAFVAQTLLNAWDADLVAIDQSGRPTVSVTISHDEWIEIHSITPVDLPDGVRPFADT
jgi:hypothetical protein